MMTSPGSPVTTRRLERLGPAACLRLLASRYLGRLARIADGWPHDIPLTYVLDDDTIVARMDDGQARRTR